MSIGIFNSEDQSLVKLASNSITADETIETLNDIKVSVATDKASVAADKATVSADKADIVSMKSEIANTKTTIDETAQTVSENANSVQQEKIAIDETKTDIDKKYTEISNTASKLNTEYNNLTSNYYTKEATNSLISSTTKLKYSVVNELPTSDISTDIIYLKSTNTTSTDGIYEMYTYQDSNWVKIGNSNPDLADYYTKELADSTFATKTEINNTNSNVSQLKDDLAYAENALGLYKPQKATASSKNANVPYTVIDNIKLINGKQYTITASIRDIINKKLYLSFYNGTGSLLTSGNIPVGETSTVIEFTAGKNYENAYITAQVAYSNISVTIEIIESGEHQNNIDKLNDRIDSAVMQIEKSEVDFSDSDNGHYINYNGTYGTTDGFSITKPFDVKKGAIITAKCAGYDTQVAIIAKVLGDKYIPLVISTDRNVNEYTYITDEDMTCVISYWNTKDYSASIAFEHDLNAIEKAITELETHSRKWAYNLWKVLCIGDSLTSGASYAEEWGEVGQTGKSIDQNYPRILGRMLNAEVTNGGVSGYSASNWYTDEVSKYNFADYDTFIIWLGTNNGLDYEDEEQHLRNLINKIKADNASCLIVLTKIFACSTGTVAGTNAIIDTIAEEYGFPVIDNSDLGSTERPDLHANVANPHFGKAGNIFIANRYVEELGKWFELDHLRSEYGYTSRTN